MVLQISLLQCNVMLSHLNAVDVVVSLCATTNNPWSLAHSHKTLDHQCVGGHRAVVVGVVELVGLKCVVVLEVVEAGDEFRARTYLAAAIETGKWMEETNCGGLERKLELSVQAHMFLFSISYMKS